MADWLQPVAEALAARKRALRWFCRDDDGGWCDSELVALMDTCEAARMPLDIAVIPKALDPAMGSMLAERIGPRLGCHQHGYAHVDHARSGRRCEFGPDRLPEQQRADLQRGMELLGLRTLGRADPIFTPPWNRCTQVTADALASMGCRALSRDRGAAPLHLGALESLPVDIDWMKWRAGSGPDLQTLGRRIGASCARGDDVGLMLHHAVMTSADLAALTDLFALLRATPGVELVLMRDLLSRLPTTVASGVGA